VQIGYIFALVFRALDLLTVTFRSVLVGAAAILADVEARPERNSF
jgi:hypothetical protein